MARSIIETITESSGTVRQVLTTYTENGNNMLDHEVYKNDKYDSGEQIILYEKIPKLKGRTVKAILDEVNKEFVDSPSGRVHRTYVK